MDNSSLTTQHESERLLSKLLENIERNLKDVEYFNLFNYFHLDSIVKINNSHTPNLATTDNLEDKILSTFEIIGTLHLTKEELLDFGNDQLFLSKIRQRELINKILVFLLNRTTHNNIQQKLLLILQFLQSNEYDEEFMKFLQSIKVDTVNFVKYINYCKSEVEQLIYIMKFEQDPGQIFYYYINEIQKLAFKLLTTKENREKYIYQYISSLASKQDISTFRSINDRFSLISIDYLDKENLSQFLTPIDKEELTSLRQTITDVYNKYLSLVGQSKLREFLFLIGYFDTRDLVNLVNLSLMSLPETNYLYSYNRTQLLLDNFKAEDIQQLKNLYTTNIDINLRFENFYKTVESMVNNSQDNKIIEVLHGLSATVSKLVTDYDLDFFVEDSEGRLLINFICELSSKNTIFKLEDAFEGNFDETLDGNNSVIEIADKIVSRIENKQLSRIETAKYLVNISDNEINALRVKRLSNLLSIALREAKTFEAIEKDSQGIISQVFFLYQLLNPKGIDEDFVDTMLNLDQKKDEEIDLELQKIFKYSISKYQTLISKIGSNLNSRKFSWLDILKLENKKDMAINLNAYQQLISLLRLLGYKVQFYEDGNFFAQNKITLLKSYLNGYKVIDY